MSKARTAVIFDRDGVLNVDHGYVGQRERFEWTAGARAAVARLNAAEVLVIVASNQSGVARGYYDLAAVDELHAAMQADLAAEGAHIDAFYICPFHPEAAVEAFRVADHPDRKPNPGMILRALADFDLAPDRALMIGDQPSDLEAARRAGVRGVLFEGGDLAEFLAGLKLPED
ncbi:MAG TPA: HAD family hydrolase [Caulobacteraceae bacterium]|nr:HAD family hydrolase [Caulobacteraceae bacterium]